MNSIRLRVISAVAVETERSRAYRSTAQRRLQLHGCRGRCRREAARGIRPLLSTAIAQRLTLAVRDSEPARACVQAVLFGDLQATALTDAQDLMTTLPAVAMQSKAFRTVRRMRSGLRRKGLANPPCFSSPRCVCYVCFDTAMLPHAYSRALAWISLLQSCGFVAGFWRLPCQRGAPLVVQRAGKPVLPDPACVAC